eukprot:3479665-Alexandrium_andersonii.AAC.1
MSASLVGSEMCIRDRPQSAAKAARNRPKLLRAVSGGIDTARRGHWALSVSYTHLTLPTICSV